MEVEAEKKDIKHDFSLTHLRRRAVVGVLRAWREVESTARNVVGSEIRPSVPREDMDRLREQMADCLEPKGGEVSARLHTAELGRTYLHLNEAGRQKFMKLLASEFDVDGDCVNAAINAWQRAGTQAEKSKAESALREALISPRCTILKQFTALPNGFKFLVDMRADLLPYAGKDARLKGLEADMKAILSAWFDVGLLDLAEITWNSPAALLEKLIAYEAVHQIRSWDDLKNRLDADRRVYAFFHNKMPLEPLIFVQVAFTEGMADNIDNLLDTESPVFDIDGADTAIFYSISNAQKGLAGISFGNFLIKRVVSELTRDFKQLKTFATLSPMPGFRPWLDPLLAKGEDSLLLPGEQKVMKMLSGSENPAKSLLDHLDSDWPRHPSTAEALKPILLRLATRYLMDEKKNGRALDPVAHFHLFNGARLERINWLADTSSKGMAQSAGIMVNYHYKLGKIDDNHEEYARDGKIVASRQVRGYL